MKRLNKTNKSHTNRIIQIVPCKTALIQLEKDLHRRICKKEIRKDVMWLLKT